MIIDIIVLATLLISAIISFLRGFMREILTIIGVAGGVIAAYFFGPSLQPTFLSWFGGEDAGKLFDLVPVDLAATASSYSSIFLIVVILLSVVSFFLSGLIKATGLGMLDRTLGVFFGLARGALLLLLFYLPIHLYVEDERDEWFEGSRSQFYLEIGSEWLATFLPEDMQPDDDDGAEEEESDTPNAREQLNALDLLPDEATDAAREALENGYGEAARDSLDELIRENATEPNGETNGEPGND